MHQFRMSHHEKNPVTEEIITHGAGRDRGLHIFGRPIGLVLIALYKGLWGTTELVAGVFLFLSIRLLTRELIEDPQDWLANWLLEHTSITHQKVFETSVVVMILGASKIILAIGLWYRSFMLRKWLLGLFAALLLFGTYHSFVHFSWLKFFALLADVLVLYYLWNIFPRHIHDPGVELEIKKPDQS